MSKPSVHVQKIPIYYYKPFNLIYSRDPLPLIKQKDHLIHLCHVVF
jgi:hypothetical protein